MLSYPKNSVGLGLALLLLAMSGCQSIDLGFYYEINTTSIISLDVYLFFLDDMARVVETAALSRSLGFRPEDSLAFAKQLKVPAGAEAIAFDYNGRARRDGSGGHGFNGGEDSARSISTIFPKE